MEPISNKFDLSILDSVPDFTDWDQALVWMDEGLKQVGTLAEMGSFLEEIVSLEWSQIAQSAQVPFGLYSSLLWRKFVLAAFFADYASYSQSVDRVSFERLLFVMHTFPEGFRVWWTKLSDGKWWPVGYSGWYPMLGTAFEIFDKTPHKLSDRMVVPCAAERGGVYLYLFNYSVAPQFKGCNLSKMLIKRYVQDIKEQKAAGLACVTVSEDGVRIAKRFGMSHVGDLVVDGCVEGVYTVAKVR